MSWSAARRAVVVGVAVVAIAFIVFLRSRRETSPDSAEAPQRESPASDVVAPEVAAPELARVAPTPPSPDVPPPEGPPAPAPVHETTPGQATALVVDEAGRAVEGVGVVESLDVLPGAPGPYERLLGRTDADGRLALSVPERVTHVRLEAGGTWHSDDRFTLPDDRDRLRFRVVSLLSVRGVVRDETGAPVAGVPVIASYAVGSARGSTRRAFASFRPTDVDGRFEGKVPGYVRAVDLRVAASGGTATARIDPTTGVETALVPSRNAWIRGLVVDWDGAPVGEGELRAFPVGGGEPSNGSVDRSSGAFAFGVPSAGRYGLVYSDPGGRYATPHPVTVDASADGVRVVCPKGRRLAGRVRGIDVRGFHVEWTRPLGGDAPVADRKRAWTDAEGRFTLDGVQPGPSTLYAFRPGDPRYALLRDIPTPDESLLVEMKEGSPVRGRVLEHGGHEGFELWIFVVWDGPTRGVAVAGDGTFSITGLPPGTYGLRWQQGDRGGAIGGRVEAGAPPVDVRVP